MPFKFRRKLVRNALDCEDEDEDLEDFEFGADEESKRAEAMDQSEQLIKKLSLQNTAEARKRMIKEKIKRAVKSQIVSFRSCVIRRTKVKLFPESADIISQGFGLMVDLCKESAENRALLFCDDSWYHLERLYRKHPMRALLLFQDVLERDKSLLFTDASIFNRIFKLYRSFCINIFFKKDTNQIPTNDGVLIFLWNTVITNILKINVKEIPITKVLHMFLTVQQGLTEEVMSFTFSHIIDLNGLVLMDDGRDIKYKFKMINQSTGTLLNLYQENDYFMGPDQAILCMEIAYSF
jgi:hypothetical protein